MLGKKKAVKFFSPDGWTYYFILSPQGDDRLAGVGIQPAITTRLPMAEQLLSTVEFTK